MLSIAAALPSGIAQHCEREGEAETGDYDLGIYFEKQAYHLVAVGASPCCVFFFLVQTAIVQYREPDARSASPLIPYANTPSIVASLFRAYYSAIRRVDTKAQHVRPRIQSIC